MDFPLRPKNYYDWRSLKGLSSREICRAYKSTVQMNLDEAEQKDIWKCEDIMMEYETAIKKKMAVAYLSSRTQWSVVILLLATLAMVFYRVISLFDGVHMNVWLELVMGFILVLGHILVVSLIALPVLVAIPTVVLRHRIRRLRTWKIAAWVRLRERAQREAELYADEE